MASPLESQIAAAFRAQELDRRRARAQILTNLAKLLEEEASEADKPGVQEAPASLQRKQDEEAQAAIARVWHQTGYWKRIWLAILGKEPFYF